MSDVPVGFTEETWSVVERFSALVERYEGQGFDLDDAWTKAQEAMRCESAVRHAVTAQSPELIALVLLYRACCHATIRSDQNLHDIKSALRAALNRAEEIIPQLTEHWLPDV